METAKLKQQAQTIRREAIKALHTAQSGHPGSSLSIADILSVLYFGHVLRYNPKRPDWSERDYFLLSNGHAVPGLYACLALAGFYPLEKLNTLRQINSPLQGHPKKGTFPGIEISAGSLGQGLSVALGLALGLKLKKQQNQVFVMMSDGEQEEGSVWEAAMLAPKYQLDNLIAIIDDNNSQINGPSRKIMPNLSPLKEKYLAFGWEVREINGHEIEAIKAALMAGKQAKKPFVIIAKTTIGRGVSFMEGDYHWHHGRLNEEQFALAMKELS